MFTKPFHIFYFVIFLKRNGQSISFQNANSDSHSFIIWALNNMFLFDKTHKTTQIEKIALALRKEDIDE